MRKERGLLDDRIKDKESEKVLWPGQRDDKVAQRQKVVVRSWDSKKKEQIKLVGRKEDNRRKEYLEDVNRQCLISNLKQDLPIDETGEYKGNINNGKQAFLPDDTNTAISPSKCYQALLLDDTNTTILPDKCYQAFLQDDTNTATLPNKCYQAVLLGDTNTAILPSKFYHQALLPDDTNTAILPSMCYQAVLPDNTSITDQCYLTVIPADCQIPEIERKTSLSNMIFMRQCWRGQASENKFKILCFSFFQRYPQLIEIIC